MRITNYLLALTAILMPFASADAGWNHINRWFGEFWSDGYHSPGDYWNTPKAVKKNNSQYFCWPNQQISNGPDASYDTYPQAWHMPGYPGGKPKATPVKSSGKWFSWGGQNEQPQPQVQYQQPQLRQPIPAAPQTRPVESVPRSPVRFEKSPSDINLDPPASGADFGFPTAYRPVQTQRPVYQPQRMPVRQPQYQNVSWPISNQRVMQPQGPQPVGQPPVQPRYVAPTGNYAPAAGYQNMAPVPVQPNYPLPNTGYNLPRAVEPNNQIFYNPRSSY